MGADVQQHDRKVRSSRILLLGPALLLWVGGALLADETSICPSFDRLPDPPNIASETLMEISGLMASRSQPGILWVHNDSGDRAVVYAINLQGRLVAEIQLVDGDGNNVVAIDCEDIALGPGAGKDDSLYLADIGDNARSRETVRIYRLTEPQMLDMPDNQVARMTTACDVIEAVYPDGPRDAETLLVDPISGDIVIVSKDFIQARVYRVPSGREDVVTLEFLTQIPWGFMTGGDISSDGSRILLRSYWSAEVWPRSSDRAWWTSLGASGCPVALAMEPQGEAIGFSANGDGYFTVSEGRYSLLNVYRVLQTDTID